MAKRDILKEAIADAKAVKETAIANAKAALEEAFTPQLKSMLAAKLEEMELDESDLEERGRSSYEEDGSKSKEKMRESDEIEEKMDMRDEVDEELDLDEILKEIEGELNEEDSVNEEETVTEESEAERADVDKFEFEKGKEEGEDDEKEELDLEDMTDEDLKGFIEDVIADMVASGELEAGENAEETEEVETDDMDVEMETEETEEVELEEEVTIEEATEESLEEDDSSIAEVYKEKYSKELEEANATIKALEESIEIKDKALEEVNLLNAKLLYTNKIFKAKNLTESEKVKVLGAFDKATTVKETKLVFETLNEGLKRRKTPIKESLGSASKATGNFKTKKPIIATDPMVARFQKLAGLK